MATYHSVRELAAAQRARHKRVASAMYIEHEAFVDTMKAKAIELTSGDVSTAELRRKGAPFARSRVLKRKGTGRFKAGTERLPINRQTGRLQRSLRVVGRNRGTGRFDVSQTRDLFFNAPYARFVLSRMGTKNMVARGFWREMEKYARQQNLRAVMRARARIA